MTTHRTASGDPGSGYGLWGVLAGLIYLVGLLAPLTPSHGHPPPMALLLFIGVPLVMLGLGAARSRSLGVKVVLVVEAIALLVLTGRLTGLPVPS